MCAVRKKMASHGRIHLKKHETQELLTLLLTSFPFPFLSASMTIYSKKEYLIFSTYLLISSMILSDFLFFQIFNLFLSFSRLFLGFLILQIFKDLFPSSLWLSNFFMNLQRFCYTFFYFLDYFMIKLGIHRYLFSHIYISIQSILQERPRFFNSFLSFSTSQVDASKY